jgi:hypothetical protein
LIRVGDGGDCVVDGMAYVVVGDSVLSSECLPDRDLFVVLGVFGA